MSYDFIGAVTTYIQTINSNFDGDYSGIDRVALAKYAWGESCAKVNEEHPSKVDTNTIANNALSSGTASDWGLDHFKSNLQTTILRGGSLVPYRGNNSTHTKFVVFNNTNIHKFDSAASFDLAKDSTKFYGAAYYFGQVGESSNESTAETAGDNYVTNYTF
tara:strand:- start:313 stop:795 length:483 start_codon:yes stop_codon:yes gene_type:complete